MEGWSRMEVGGWRGMGDGGLRDGGWRGRDWRAEGRGWRLEEGVGRRRTEDTFFLSSLAQPCIRRDASAGSACDVGNRVRQIRLASAAAAGAPNAPDRQEGKSTHTHIQTVADSHTPAVPSAVKFNQ